MARFTLIYVDVVLAHYTLLSRSAFSGSRENSRNRQLMNTQAVVSYKSSAFLSKLLTRTNLLLSPQRQVVSNEPIGQHRPHFPYTSSGYYLPSTQIWPATTQSSPVACFSLSSIWQPIDPPQTNTSRSPHQAPIKLTILVDKQFGSMCIQKCFPLEPGLPRTSLFLGVKDQR
jgi:hypothetical protein